MSAMDVIDNRAGREWFEQKDVCSECLETPEVLVRLEGVDMHESATICLKCLQEAVNMAREALD